MVTITIENNFQQKSHLHAHTINVIQHYGGCKSSFFKLVFCLLFSYIIEYLSTNVVYIAILRKYTLPFKSRGRFFKAFN